MFSDTRYASRLSTISFLNFSHILSLFSFEASIFTAQSHNLFKITRLYLNPCPTVPGNVKPQPICEADR